MDFRRLINILTASACLLSLSACSLVTDDEVIGEENKSVSASYINLTISVSNGETRATRAGDSPMAGEDGNGREVGFDRENAITGVTVILYRSENGVNTVTSETNDPLIEFLRFYPVSRLNKINQGTSYDFGSGDSNHATQVEAEYTTGPQPIGRGDVLVLDKEAEYHAIVVANYDLTHGEGRLIEKSSKLSDLQKLELSKLYSGSYTGNTHDAVSFVMSSEEDNTISLKDGILKNYDGSERSEEGDEDKEILYDLSNQPLIIERMAARIDFWAKGATYRTKSGDGDDKPNYANPGYVYKVVKSDGLTTSNDRFVLTRITPFNLNSGKEFLLKHLSDGLLKPEKGIKIDNNYVIDPLTSSKTDSSTPETYENALSSIASLTDLSENDYVHTIEAMHAQVGSGLTGGFDYDDGSTKAEDVLICYPMENALPVGASLYSYATGIAIEGDYYKEDDVSQKEHRIYYTFIRHEGESSEPYEALLGSQLATAKNSSTNPMNYGIVRNNIYRVYIDKVEEKPSEILPPKIKLLIKVKKWDKFVHAPIHM